MSDIWHYLSYSTKDTLAEKHLLSALLLSKVYSSEHVLPGKLRGDEETLRNYACVVITKVSDLNLISNILHYWISKRLLENVFLFYFNMTNCLNYMFLSVNGITYFVSSNSWMLWLFRWKTNVRYWNRKHFSIKSVVWRPEGQGNRTTLTE